MNCTIPSEDGLDSITFELDAVEEQRVVTYADGEEDIPLPSEPTDYADSPDDFDV